MKFHPLLHALSLAALTTVTVTPVYAQTVSDAERTARVALMVRAEEARAAGRLDEALRLAQQAEQIGATAGTRMFLARLYGQRSDWVASFTNAGQCLREVDLDTQTTAANRRALRSACEGYQHDAEGHLARVTVRVPGDAPSEVAVFVNGQLLRPALYGVEQVMLAGTITLRTTLGNRPPWERTENVSEGMHATLDVSVPTVASPPPPPPPPHLPPTEPPSPQRSVDASTQTTPPVEQPPNVPQEAPRPGSTQRTLAWVSGVTGLVLVGGAAVAGIAFGQTVDGYDVDGCATQAMPTASCYDRFNNTLPMLNTLQLAGYIGGGVLVATSVILFATAPSARQAPALSVVVGPGGNVGLGYGGRF